MNIATVSLKIEILRGNPKGDYLSRNEWPFNIISLFHNVKVLNREDKMGPRKDREAINVYKRKPAFIKTAATKTPSLTS